MKMLPLEAFYFLSMYVHGYKIMHLKCTKRDILGKGCIFHVQGRSIEDTGCMRVWDDTESVGLSRAQDENIGRDFQVDRRRAFRPG